MSVLNPAAPATRVLLTPAQLAERWSCSVKTLANKRSDGSGPDFLRVLGGRAIRYSLDAIVAWEAAHLVAQVAL